MSKNRKIIRLTIIIAVFLLVIFTLYGITDKSPETVTIGYLPTDQVDNNKNV